jgi:DNA primase small subunit
MDHNVSTSQNHLLKLPFSVHPTSLRICVPLDRQQLELFDPKRCITIKGLIAELNDLGVNNLSGKYCLIQTATRATL